jgi:hypothetical protein
MQDPIVEHTKDLRHEPVCEYVRMVISLIERRRISRDDFFSILEQIWRQHSLSHTCRTDYVWQQSNKSPP